MAGRSVSRLLPALLAALAALFPSSALANGNLLVFRGWDGGEPKIEERTPEGTFVKIFASGFVVGQMVVGPSGHLYVATSSGIATIPAAGGTPTPFVLTGSGGLDVASGLAFGSDGNLYVTSQGTDQVLRYNGGTGAFMDVFISDTGDHPLGLLFVPDGSLLVASYDGIRRFDGVTGIYLSDFAPVTSGAMHLGPDDKLYIFRGGRIDRYDPSTGAFLGIAVDGLYTNSVYFTFLPNGDYYVSVYDFDFNWVERYSFDSGHFYSYLAGGFEGEAPNTLHYLHPPGDLDVDGVPDDGDASGNIYDHPCAGGATSGCDDNCLRRQNADQTDADGDAKGDACELDDDGDSILDTSDNCPGVANPGQENHDADSLGDACDADDDNDGLSDSEEATLGTNPLAADTDGDGDGDAADNCPLASNANQMDTDADGDGDACDNCRLVLNPDQANHDTDADGDACDVDDDNDSLLDAADNCPLAANANQADFDGDAQGDDCDADDDDDGYSDAEEIAAGSNPLDATSTPEGAAVPTLGEWGAMALMLGLAAAARRRLRRR